MPECSYCGKTIETSRPMVLIGSQKFVQSPPNGRVWVGEAPSVRIWKTFAVLSVGICPECLQKEKKKRLIRNLSIGAAAILYLVLYTLLVDYIPEGFLASLTGILFFAAIIVVIGSIIALIVNRSAFRKSKEDIGNITLSHYQKIHRIPKKDILADAAKYKGAALEDININEITKVQNPYLGTQSFYALKLYAQDELDKIGAENDGMPQGLEEALLTAKLLFAQIS